MPTNLAKAATRLFHQEDDKDPEDVPFSMSLLNSEQKKRLESSFSIFDTDGSGLITLAEVANIFRLLGVQTSDLELELLVKSIDKNNDGLVQFEEFALMWWEREKINAEADWDTDLEYSFQLLDLNGSGDISAQELRKVLTSIGQKMTDAEVDAMLAESDVDNDGSISLEEFKAMKCWRGPDAFEFSVTPDDQSRMAGLDQPPSSSPGKGKMKC